MMFDVDSFIERCRTAVRDADPRRAIRAVLQETLERPMTVADAIGKQEAGINVIYNDESLTVLNVIWAPSMQIMPHDHRMWAAIGIYGGAEDNTLYRRTSERIQASGGRQLQERDVMILGSDAIHSVANPQRRFTGAIHVYGGDFVNMPRSQWDPETLIEQPYDLAYVRTLFARANAEWAAQVDEDLDEEASVDR